MFAAPPTLVFEPSPPHPRSLLVDLKLSLSRVNREHTAIYYETMGEAVDSPTFTSSSFASEVDIMEQEQSDLAVPVKGFWRLPPEIRNAIYEELLVTDCAFRLGYTVSFRRNAHKKIRLLNKTYYRHHGPYSHEKRKTLHPEILRTCSQAYHESVAILYGNNTFFLGEYNQTFRKFLGRIDLTTLRQTGPLGFKPTYSASFLTSIGSHNALRIRTIVAHCIHPNLLTKPYLSRWFANLGLDFPSLKIIAVSVSQAGDDTKSRIISIPPPPVPAQFHLPTNLPPLLGSQWPAGVLTPSVVTPPAVAPAPIVPGAGLLTANAGHAQGQGHVRVDSAREVVPETEFDMAVGRTKGWMEKRKRSDVETLVSLRNTDLRAGDEWLVYVSPAVKKRMGIKIW